MLFAAALFPAGEARGVPAIKRDHCAGQSMQRRDRKRYSYKLHCSVEIMVLAIALIRVSDSDRASDPDARRQGYSSLA